MSIDIAAMSVDIAAMLTGIAAMLIGIAAMLIDIAVMLDGIAAMLIDIAAMPSSIAARRIRPASILIPTCETESGTANAYRILLPAVEEADDEPDELSLPVPHRIMTLLPPGARASLPAKACEKHA